MAKKSKHRALFDKAKVIRKATAELVEDPTNEAKRSYLRGICDGVHGTSTPETALAIHVARQAIIAVQE